MKTLLATDLHLTDNERDSYRWGLFSWLAKTIIAKKVDSIYFLGDITDAKDKHSAILVNRIVEEMHHLAEHCPVTILRGNHDYLRDQQAFLSFLNRVPNIEFVDKVTKKQSGDKYLLFLPHTRQPEFEWANINFYDYDLIFMHETAKGSLVSNGTLMEEGIDGNFSDKELHPDTMIFSGDIHVPQQIGKIIYVGSPYPVHFGDKFKGRCILFDDQNPYETFQELHFPTIEKFTATIKSVDDVKDLSLESGDQVKLKLELTPAEYSDWQKTRQEVMNYLEEKGVLLCGFELHTKKTTRVRLIDAKKTASSRNYPDALRAYAKSQKLEDELVETGLVILGYSK